MRQFLIILAILLVGCTEHHSLEGIKPIEYGNVEEKDYDTTYIFFDFGCIVDFMVHIDKDTHENYAYTIEYDDPDAFDYDNMSMADYITIEAMEEDFRELLDDTSKSIVEQAYYSNRKWVIVEVADFTDTITHYTYYLKRTGCN